MKTTVRGLATFFATLLLTTIVSPVSAEDFDLLIIEEESDELLILDDQPGLPTNSEAPDDSLILDSSEDENGLFIDEGDGTPAEPPRFTSYTADKSAGPTIKLNRLWVEYGHFTQQSADKNHQGYMHGLATAEWSPSSAWEFHASVRADGYRESGRNDWSDFRLDYDEIYARYKTASSIFTVGTQRVLWGRIDELPPTDRLSTQDFRRFVIDDLEDRRLASPALRMEHFFGDSKIDFVLYPHFRETQLADRDSTWYPVNKRTGEILSLKTTALAETIVKNVPIKENAPDSEGGAGIRFSTLGSGFDYALTVQKGRQTVPYFSYNPDRNIIEGKYPRTWIVGGDFGIEALGGTVKFEAAWLSDTPVTRVDGSYTTVKSISWGAALELFPGDGDARLNLQLTGVRLLRAPVVMDRAEIYALNGSYDVPFAQNRWRAKFRFNVGLDKKDIYFNPEIAYTGWEAQEVYLEFHFFDGSLGTPGGFYQDNGILTLGWRADY